MIKFIIPAVVIFLIVLFWDNINKTIYRKFNIKINNIAVLTLVFAMGLIFVLLYF
tara:strand:+ start:258 stop:422 length:165 start_codon:yes stop_codon:yes gene_type:complete